MPQVTVVMTAYNRENFIAESIESFLEQTYEFKELLICDDCSKDRTFEIASAYARQHPHIRVLRNEVNKGFIYTINRLFHSAGGEYICILDSDDCMTADRIEHQVKLLDEYAADGVCSEYFRGRDMQHMEPQKPRTPQPVIMQPGSEDVFLPAGSILFKKKVLEQVEGFDEYFSDTFCGDIYFINLLAEKYKLLYDPKNVYYYRLHHQSLTQEFNLYKYSKLEVVKKLVAQRKQEGTDYLEQKDTASLRKMQEQILADRKWISNQYRLFAAREIDDNRLSKAFSYLAKAFVNRPLGATNLRTYFYFLRRLVLYPFSHQN